jgi:hypothetical protein
VLLPWYSAHDKTRQDKTISFCTAAGRLLSAFRELELTRAMHVLCWRCSRVRVPCTRCKTFSAVLLQRVPAPFNIRGVKTCKIQYSWFLFNIRGVKTAETT